MIVAWDARVFPSLSKAVTEEESPQTFLSFCKPHAQPGEGLEAEVRDGGWDVFVCVHEVHSHIQAAGPRSTTE